MHVVQGACQTVPQSNKIIQNPSTSAGSSCQGSLAHLMWSGRTQGVGDDFCWTSLIHTDLYWFSCVEGISRFHESKDNRKICPCPWKLAMGSTRWSPSHFHSLLVARAFAVRPAFHSSQHSWSQGAFMNWNVQCWRCEHVWNSGCLLL